MPKTIITVLIEAVVVGLVLIPMAYIAGYFAKHLVGKPSLPEICSKWNENHIMEVNLFLAGFLFHIVCQVSGVNKWYVDNYYK
jgi:hypothetical protein